MPVDTSHVCATAELERSGWDFNQGPDGKLKCRCPFHEDKRPSCSIDPDKNTFKCYAASCGMHGDILTFLAGALRVPRAVICKDIDARYGIKSPKKISLDTVEKYHSQIWDAGPLLAALRRKGVSDGAVRERRLGVCRGRVTIPILGPDGRCVNIRRYLPNAPSSEKMRNTSGYGVPPVLYPIEQLKYDIVMVCGGEMKAIVAADLLNEEGVGALSSTAGEGSWRPEFTDALAGKKVYVCLDIDKGGKKATAKICAMIARKARWVGNVALPLDPRKYANGDLNDWVSEGAKTKDFKKLLDSTVEWRSDREKRRPAEPAVFMGLSEAVKASNVDKTIIVQVMVIAIDSSPFIVPRTVLAQCSQDQKFCEHCALYCLDRDDDGKCKASIPSDSSSILDMVGSPRRLQRSAILEGLRAPRCKTVRFETVEWYSIEDLYVSPQLGISGVESHNIVQRLMFVGTGIELNENYMFTGRVQPHPANAQSVILATEKATVLDSLTDYRPPEGTLKSLRVFRPAEWTVESLKAHLDGIYSDLSFNVTRIFRRPELHLALDLAWHSPLLLRYEGRVVKGWTEVLVLGDSSQGKSEAMEGLMRHYGLGVKIDMKNATVAGLVGGLHQIGNRWFVSWGIMPTHDRRLVVLEELKGAETSLIAKLTDMRSSGMAELTKIQRRRAQARTRLVALSNPRSDRPLNSYSYGVEAIKELVGSLEDIRRFDLIIMPAIGDVDPAEINSLKETKSMTPHLYTDELCKALVLWAWTRKPENVEFEDGVPGLVFKRALELCSRFTETIPIVDGGSIRLKLMRLASALAARTFSHGNDLSTLVVRPCHVDYIADFMIKQYSSPVFGYEAYSSVVRSMSRLEDPDEIERRLNGTPFPFDLTRQILNTEQIELKDLCDWCSWRMEDAIHLLSLLVRKHALRRDRQSYRKTAPFIELLKEMLTKKPDQRPKEEY